MMTVLPRKCKPESGERRGLSQSFARSARAGAASEKHTRRHLQAELRLREQHGLREANPTEHVPRLQRLNLCADVRIDFAAQSYFFEFWFGPLHGRKNYASGSLSVKTAAVKIVQTS